MTDTLLATDVLTAADVVALATVVDMARDRHIRWVVDGLIHGGTARHLVKSAEDYGFLTRDMDVRDAVIRVTLDSGWETVIPVGEAVRLVQADCLFVD